MEQLAEAAGISRDAVVRIEDGRRNPRLGTTEALAKALEVTLADLVGGTQVASKDDERMETIRLCLARVEPELADRVVAAVAAFCSGNRKIGSAAGRSRKSG